MASGCPKIERYPGHGDQGEYPNGNVKALQCDDSFRARLRTHEEPNCGNQKSCKKYGSDNHVYAQRSIENPIVTDNSASSNHHGPTAVLAFNDIHAMSPTAPPLYKTKI